METEAYGTIDAAEAPRNNERTKRSRETNTAAGSAARRPTSRQEAMGVDGGKVMRVLLMHALAKRAAEMVARAGATKRQRKSTGGKRKRGAVGDERPSKSVSTGEPG